MRQDRALLTACCTDMSAGAFSAQIQAFRTTNPVGFLVVNRPSLPAQQNMNTRATVAYPGFRYFPDTQGYRPIVTPALPVVNGSALHQQPASPPDADSHPPVAADAAAPSRPTGKFFLPVNGMDYLLPLRLTVRNVLTRRITMNIVFLGIDLAKNVFQLCGLNQAGKPVYTKRTGRKELLQALANIPACLIGIEASTGAFYWQREFEKLGHKVKVISPQYVKPFVRGQKNDGNDAQAIAVALMQPTMQFVPPKSPEQQDIQALHRARQRIVNHRTATVCQIRGLLLDRGIPIGSAVSRARRAIPLILGDAENGLSSRMRRTIAELYDLFNDLGRRIHFFDKEIETVFRQSEACQRIAKVKGIGPKTATAVVAAIGKGTEFKNGRHFAAWLGLVPRQHSSGDRHLRTLFIHGAPAVVRVATNNNDGHMNQWVNQLKERRGFNKTTVAVANKNARIIWSMLRNDTGYQVV